MGFGSFYNHFDSKEAVVEAVLSEEVTAHGTALESVTSGLDDPAEVVAVAHRYFVTLARTDPGWGWLLIRLDMSQKIGLEALGSFARRDLERGIRAGRFRVSHKRVALYAAGGALLGVMRDVLEGARAQGRRLPSRRRRASHVWVGARGRSRGGAAPDAEDPTTETLKKHA